MIELQKVYRQEDVAFIDLLDRIRVASVDDRDIRRLNERVEPDRASAIYLTPFKAAAGQVNSVHKSQGQTFEDITVDLGKGAFAAGQTYVALSRSTTLEGIVLRRPVDESDIFADPRVEDSLTACRARSA